MLNLGLKAADKEAFEAGLRSDHKVRIRVDLLDLDHHVVGTCTGRVITGQIDWDTTNAQEVTRTASVQVWNPGDVLNLGTLGTPLGAAFYADRMISIHYEVWSQQLPRWVSVPMFVGPITKVESGDNDTVTISADDKQRLMMDGPNVQKTYPKGARLTDSMMDLAHTMGETFCEFVPSPVRSTHPYTTSTKVDAWYMLRSFAGGVPSTVLSYDARGYLRLQPRVSAPVADLRTGLGGNLLSEPKITNTPGELINCVTVTGGTPAGSKGIAAATVYAPADHPLNGWNIGRGGVPRWLVREIQDDSITSASAALSRANAELAAAMQVAAEIECDILTIPHLEPGDVVTVHGHKWVWNYQIAKATIPLDGSGHMTIGRTYSVAKQVRPRVMPRKGRGYRPQVHTPVKTPVKKADPKKATAHKKTTTHATKGKK